MEEVEAFHVDDGLDYSGNVEELIKIYGTVFNPETSPREKWKMDSA